MEKDVNKKKNNEDKKQEVIKEELKNKIDVNKKKKRRSRRKSKSKASLKKKIPTTIINTVDNCFKIIYVDASNPFLAVVPNLSFNV